MISLPDVAAFKKIKVEKLKVLKSEQHLGNSMATYFCSKMNFEFQTLLNNVLPLQWPGCLFPYIVNYEWWCSDPNSSYQIQVDYNSSPNNLVFFR